MAVATRTDEEIKRDVVDELYWDDRVDAVDVKVEVHDGRVILSGTVPTYAARVAADEDAHAVAGPRDVINELTVKYPTTAAVPTDAQIEASINNALRWDSQVDGSDIEVISDAGWVTLKGTVPSYWQKIRAEDIALSKSGVRDVTNELAVVPTQTFADRRIADDIVGALERNVYVSAEDVDVKVSNGVVTLRGTVPDRRAHRAARNAARRTPGVINDLAID